jgi:GH24 family phage-related lysozyme (muramidase)
VERDVCTQFDSKNKQIKQKTRREEEENLCCFSSSSPA